jgi:hypothetical protein
MKTKRIPRVGTSPRVSTKQIHENFTGFDIFRGEHPDDDSRAFQKAIKVRMTPTKRRRIYYRFEQPIHRTA